MFVFMCVCVCERKREEGKERYCVLESERDEERKGEDISVCEKILSIIMITMKIITIMIIIIVVIIIIMTIIFNE